MKQVLVRGGGVAVEEVPAPMVSAGHVLVRVAYSCVSAGTELTSVRRSGLPLYRRALEQPQQAKRVLELARDQGLLSTVQRVRGRLAAGLPSGYSAAGTVVALGEDVVGFALGDRVACAGAGIANHAEFINVPVNLAARVPDGVSLDDASTATLGAIALQGVRRAAPTLGESVGVIGLGIIGQLVAQLLRANGCHVIGSDVDATRVAQARQNGMAHGADDPARFVDTVLALTDGHGADAVIVTAATPSSDVVHQAFLACRKKGRVVLVGDVGLDLDRSDLYEKELDFLISTSYGPGRYDPEYELGGRDYPIGYVRWTENRNLEEYLRCLADGRVALGRLPRESYEIDAAAEAYAALARPEARPLLTLLRYPDRVDTVGRTVRVRDAVARPGRIGTAIVGAGNFAEGTHIPNLLRLRERFDLRAVASRTGATARSIALRNGAAYATTDLATILADPQIQLVIVATRHDTHARLALEALGAGKNVLVEKPLAITRTELAEIEAFFADRTAPVLMTGFNRRFSPAARRMREILAKRSSPLVATYRMNAGYIPPAHWVHGPEGGGRNIGEACHIYDLFGFLTGSAPTSVSAHAIRSDSKRWLANDNFTATVTYADGSVCTLVYSALGHRDHPKERCEVFADGVVLSLDDYRSLAVAGAAGGWSSRTVEKGHLEELRALGDRLSGGGQWPIPLEDQLAAMRVAFDVEDQISRR